MLHYNIFILLQRVSNCDSEAKMPCMKRIKFWQISIMFFAFIVISLSSASFASDGNIIAPAHEVFQNKNVFFALVLIVVIFFWSSAVAIKGKKPYIRRIAGLQAVEEAVGRATEMGKPVLFVAGIEDVDNVQTLALLVK